MNKSILLAGVGGQGTVLASKLIAQAAIDLGFPARTAETIGMAQRGGCVVSHVRIGEAHSPLIPKGKADIIIGFEPAEAVRCLPYLKEEGVVVTTKKGHQAGDRVSVRLLLRRHGNDRLLNPKPGKACGGGRRKNLRRLWLRKGSEYRPIGSRLRRRGFGNPKEKLSKRPLRAGCPKNS